MREPWQSFNSRSSRPYYRNNRVAVAHLQMSGHVEAAAESWAGGTEGIRVPHPDSPHHDVELGQHPDGPYSQWHMRVVRKPEDPGYSQDGLHLGRSQIARLPSPGPEKHQPRDDEYNAAVTAHPRDVAKHFEDFVRHPSVRNAVVADTEKIKTERKLPGPLGDQFKPRQGD